MDRGYNEDLLKHVYYFYRLDLQIRKAGTGKVVEDTKKAISLANDTTYRSLVYHKTGTKLKKLEPRWPKLMTEQQSKTVIENNKWYYETFYPEAL